MFYQNIGSSGAHKLQTMFSQVQNIVTSMLENIAYIYQTNGINYQIKQLQQVIVRLVSPVQLFANQKSWKSIYEREIVSYNKNHLLSSQNQRSKGYNWTTAKNSPDQAFQYRELTQIQSFPKRRQGCLGDQMEEQICKRAYSRAKKGIVLRRDIVCDAIALAKQKGIPFQGSTGWFTRFLRRNPDIRQLLQFQKQLSRREQTIGQEQSSQQWKLELASQDSEIKQKQENQSQQRNQGQKKKYKNQIRARVSHAQPKNYQNNLKDEDIYGLEQQS